MIFGRIVCKERVRVDPAKVATIMNMDTPTSVKQLKSTLGHRGYYRRFIHNYSSITTPMNKVLRKVE